MAQKILFIDDELTQVSSDACKASKTLCNMGYTVIHNCSFAWNEVWEIIQKNYLELRLIICDIYEGEGTEMEPGWEIIQSIKQGAHNIPHNNYSNYLKNIPVIIYSKGNPIELQKSHPDALALGNYITIIQKKDIPYLTYYSKILIELFDEICSDKLRYKIAISYTWVNNTTNQNHQNFVEAVAQALYCEYSKEKIFLDIGKQHLINGKTSIDVVEQYKKSDYVLVFLSNDYCKTGWTKDEWQTIKEIGKDRVLFLAIEDININELGITLYPEAPRDKSDKIINIQRIFPQYFPCVEYKKKFDSYKVIDKFTEFIKYWKDTIVNEIVNNFIIRTLR